MANDAFHIYDTTLRDGAQQEGLNLSVHDKLVIARHLDELGVGFIEGGWPGANPKDTEFFKRAQTELKLKNATFVAFGATRRPNVKAGDDPLLKALADSGAPVVTLVAKSHDRHVDLALKTNLDENLAMIKDSIKFLRANGQRVFLDAEHFFDGYKSNRAYAIEVVRASVEAGADVVALCDTNGGMLPDELTQIVSDVLATTSSRLGIHCHNDTGCAVANSLAAINAGVTHVQGTLNGYGERTGNADLVSIIANLELKKKKKVLPDGALREAFRISHAVAEVTNVAPSARQPYVGISAFAHKAGLHASAIKVDPAMYQHEDPAEVGNDMRMLVSDMAGRASIVSSRRTASRHSRACATSARRRACSRARPTSACGSTSNSAIWAKFFTSAQCPNCSASSACRTACCASVRASRSNAPGPRSSNARPSCAKSPCVSHRRRCGMRARSRAISPTARRSAMARPF